MESELYNQIINEYRQLREKYGLITDMRFVLNDLNAKFCSSDNKKINEETIRSIISYQFQKEQKETTRLINWPAVFEDYYGNAGMLSIAATARISPAMISQRIISNLLSSSVGPNQLKEIQFNSNLIDNCALAYETMLAHYSDPFYGMHYTQISNNSGQVFEQTVENYLRKANVDFMNEDELRKKKFDVTPDFKLNIPVILERHWSEETNAMDSDDFSPKRKCIKNYLITKPIEFYTLKSNNLNPDKLLTIEDKNIKREIINWIECKSLFANEQCHEEYVQKQYNSYANRFGKGLVIYNYGCLDKTLEEDAKFIVLTELPEIKD